MSILLETVSLKDIERDSHCRHHQVAIEIGLRLCTVCFEQSIVAPLDFISGTSAHEGAIDGRVAAVANNRFNMIAVFAASQNINHRVIVFQFR